MAIVILDVRPLIDATGAIEATELGISWHGREVNVRLPLTPAQLAAMSLTQAKNQIKTEMAAELTRVGYLSHPLIGLDITS